MTTKRRDFLKASAAAKGAIGLGLIPRVLAGEDVRYEALPWFWSDQYDLKLQIAGLSEGYDDVVIRGNPAERSFSCLYLRDGRLIAVDAINAPRDFVQSKQLIADRAEIEMEKLADTATPLKDMAA